MPLKTGNDASGDSDEIVSPQYIAVSDFYAEMCVDYTENPADFPSLADMFILPESGIYLTFVLFRLPDGSFGMEAFHRRGAEKFSYGEATIAQDGVVTGDFDVLFGYMTQHLLPTRAARQNVSDEAFVQEEGVVISQEITPLKWLEALPGDRMEDD